LVDGMAEARKAMLSEFNREVSLCVDDQCDPIPEELFILIALKRKDLFDYCHMRIFNTLFGQDELEDSLREVLWPLLLRID